MIITVIKVPGQTILIDGQTLPPIQAMAKIEVKDLDQATLKQYTGDNLVFDGLLKDSKDVSYNVDGHNLPEKGKQLHTDHGKPSVRIQPVAGSRGDGSGEQRPLPVQGRERKNTNR